MNHKAQMASPLSFIFAIIIGGVVFLFLVGFAYNFLALSGSLSAAETVQALNDEFSAFSISESAEKAIDYNQDFDFTVYEGKITSNQQTQSIDQILFSPLKIKGDQLFVATKALELPYKVGNLFYLGDGSTVYILIYDSDSEEVVDDLVNSYNSIPNNFPSYAFSITQVSANVQELSELTAQYSSVRFVFFTGYDKILDDIQSTFSSYEILEVESSEEDYAFGVVTFPDGEEAIYLDYPLLVGAMVAADSHSYLYNLDLVMEKLSIVTGVYYDKAKFVSVRLPACEYASIKTALNNYRSFVGDTESYQSYITKMELVEDANDALGGGCPEIF
jgi:hypothetical protein